MDTKGIEGVHRFLLKKNYDGVCFNDELKR